MQYLRLLLLPFSLIYGLVIVLRNLAYDMKLFRSQKFNLPLIAVGNLAVGGAGKSPMTEHIVRMFHRKYRVAVLSRGYGRKTKGFRLVTSDDTAAEAGDEPLQFRNKFDDITVAVSEDRRTGINELKSSHDIIVLDDAFQHRAVQPGLSILLFDYTRRKDFRLMLPAGNLREPFRGRKRADVLVITKTPPALTIADRQKLISWLRPALHQKVLFSYLDYCQLIPLQKGDSLPLTAVTKNLTVFLVTGIANPLPLVEELQQRCGKLKHYDYPDHHPFSPKNIAKLADDFRKDNVASKMIITTEKDAQRLKGKDLSELLSGLPVYYLPVDAKFHAHDEKIFEDLIENYVSKYLQHNRIH